MPKRAAAKKGSADNSMDVDRPAAQPAGAAPKKGSKRRGRDDDDDDDSDEAEGTDTEVRRLLHH